MTREYLHTQSPSNVSAVCGSVSSLLSPIQYKERRETMDEAWDIFDSFQSALTSAGLLSDADRQHNVGAVECYCP